jgi:hypothetical protein
MGKGAELSVDSMDADAAQAKRRPVNFRSVILGLIGVVFICGLTPYNDWVVNNTYLVGNYLPIGLLLFFLTFIMVVNGALWRWRERWAFNSSELAVAMGMVMVGCGVPSSGLMRYLPAALIGVTYQPGVEPSYVKMFQTLDLPKWIFPSMNSTHPVDRANEAVVQNYWGRTPGVGPTWADHFHAVPWAAWVTPAVAWGVMIFAFWGAVLCIAVIVRRQWVENERLPFPIAQIYLSLIEPPAKGRMLNALFRSPAFWGAAGVLFFVNGINALAQYDPRHWPKIPLGYDLTSILTEGFWRYTEPEDPGALGLRRNVIYFSIVGITFFLQTKVAFSLWFFYVFFQIERILWGALWGGSFSYFQQQDQQVGSLLPFFLAMVWVGREHWKMVIRQMFLREREGDVRGRYLPYSLAGWGLVGCLAIMVGWLVAAGASVIGAAFLVMLIITIAVVVARVVAETGLLFVQLGFPYWRPWIEMIKSPLAIRTTGRSFFYHGLFSMVIGHDVREHVSVFRRMRWRWRMGLGYMSEESDGR